MSDPYAVVKEHFDNVSGVTVNAGKGAQGMKVGKKMFVMFYKGDLAVQLPPTRVSELVASVKGVAFDPRTGKPMTDTWIRYCDESQAYAESKL